MNYVSVYTAQTYKNGNNKGAAEAARCNMRGTEAGEVVKFWDNIMNDLTTHAVRLGF